MSKIVATPDEILHIEAKTRESGRDLAYWRSMRTIRIFASSRPHTVLKSIRDPAAVDEGFLKDIRFWSPARAYRTALEAKTIKSFEKEISALVGW